MALGLARRCGDRSTPHQPSPVRSLAPGELKNGWGLGAPAETPERWQLISPAFQVDKIHAPLLLQMPEQEYLETLDYFVPLANSPTPIEMYVFPNEPHQKILARLAIQISERRRQAVSGWRNA
jgi:hypothetical protein